MDKITTQQEIQQDLERFDIDDYLLLRKQELDNRVKEYLIKVQALRIARGIK